MDLIVRNISAFLICTLAACTPVAVTEIEWKDGDSGIIDGVEFRLKDVDAPETSPVGDRPGQAKCELERRRGFAAADYMRAFTRSCLLYTSPSPRDLSTSRMPSSA